jgi:hypothetical protein
MIRIIANLALALCILTACSRNDAQPSTSTPPLVDVNNEDFKKATQDRLERMRQEESVIEAAPWFGKTGLSDETERELPRYIRRELGQLLSDPRALTAADLEYVGVFSDGVATIHYWRMPSESPQESYAYVEVNEKGDSSLGWGDKRPPQK